MSNFFDTDALSAETRRAVWRFITKHDWERFICRGCGLFVSRPRERSRPTEPQYCSTECFKRTDLRKAVRSSSDCPNKVERKLMPLLNEFDFRYVGDGNFWVGNRNSDFVSEPRKTAVELFGCYWHGCPMHYSERDCDLQSRTLHYQSHGWSIFVVWEHELLDMSYLTQRLFGLFGE